MGVCPSRVEPLEMGVTNLHTRCEANDKGLRKQEKHINKLKNRMDATEQEFNEKMTKDMVTIRNRLEDMEQNFVKQIVNVRERLDKIEEKQKNIDENKKQITKIGKTLTQVETEIVKKVMDDMTAVRSRIVELERNLIDQVMDIRGDVGNLETWQFDTKKKLEKLMKN